VASCDGIERQITVAMPFPHQFASRTADSHSKEDESNGSHIEEKQEDGMLHRAVDSNRWWRHWLRRNRSENQCGHAVSPRVCQSQCRQPLKGGRVEWQSHRGKARGRNAALCSLIESVAAALAVEESLCKSVSPCHFPMSLPVAVPTPTQRRTNHRHIT
jgi:hypothetical protein